MYLVRTEQWKYDRQPYADAVADRNAVEMILAIYNTEAIIDMNEEELKQTIW